MTDSFPAPIPGDVGRERPVVTVLGETVDDRPDHLDALGGRIDFRFTDEAGLAAAVEGADALLLWKFFSEAVREVWPRCDSLQWIHVAAAGVDKLVFPELAASDVVVTNARGVFDRPIAEFVLGSVLAHAKGMQASHDFQRRHVWSHRETLGIDGKLALVIGTGGIGRAIARLLRAAGMEVRAAGRVTREGDPDLGDVVESARLTEHVGDVDYLVNAAPLTPATTGLIDARVLAALPDHAHVVNIGRGQSVVESDLIAALRAGTIDGASLDVFETEPLPQDSPLWDLPGVVVSGHMAGDVVGWKDTLARQFVANAERWLDGEPLENVVDTERGYVPSSHTLREGGHRG